MKALAVTETVVSLMLSNLRSTNCRRVDVRAEGPLYDGLVNRAKVACREPKLRLHVNLNSHRVACREPVGFYRPRKPYAVILSLRR